MAEDCLRRVSLTDAALPPPLPGKEVRQVFLNFDPTELTRHFRKHFFSILFLTGSISLKCRRYGVDYNNINNVLILTSEGIAE